MKWKEASLILAGGTTVIGLFIILTQLTGVNATYSGDIICDSVCESYINVSTTYWRICFSHYNNSMYENETLFKKVSRSRTLHINLDKVTNIIQTEPEVKVDWLVPTYGGKWRPLKDRDCWERGKINKIKLVGHKDPTQTIKWSFILESNQGGYATNINLDIDPLWEATNSTSGTSAGSNIEHRLKWNSTNLTLGGYKFYICNGLGNDLWCFDEDKEVIATETSFINESGGTEPVQMNLYAVSALATEDAADRLDDWATGAPNCVDHCVNWEANCAWMKNGWNNNASIVLTYNMSLYAKNVTIYYDEYETLHSIDLWNNETSTWVNIHSGLSNDCPHIETFTKTTYLVNRIRINSTNNDWCGIDAVKLGGETQGTAPPKYNLLTYNNTNFGDKYIFFASDDLQPFWMVTTGVEVSKYIVDQGLAYIPSLSVGDGSALDYYYNDLNLDLFFDTYYTKPNMEIGFQGEHGTNDEMMNLSYANVTAKLQRMYDTLETGLGTFYDVNNTVSPGCTYNFTAASLKGYADMNISIGRYCYTSMDTVVEDEWKEESSVSGFMWMPEDTATFMENGGSGPDMRNSSAIINDCFQDIQELGFCTLFFHVQDFQDPINTTRYDILKEVVAWVKENQTLKEWGVINNVTLSEYRRRILNSTMTINNYDDYYNYTNTTAELKVEADCILLADQLLYNGSNANKHNYTFNYAKFHGVSDVNLSVYVGQPLSDTNNTGYYFENITIEGEASKWERGSFIQFNSTMCNAGFTQCWSNTTHSIISTIDKTVYWRFWANDTSGAINHSDIFSYETTSGAVPELDYGLNGGITFRFPCDLDSGTSAGEPEGQNSTLSSIWCKNNGTGTGNVQIKLSQTLPSGWEIYVSNTSSATRINLTTNYQTLYSGLTSSSNVSCGFFYGNCSVGVSTPMGSEIELNIIS